MTNEATGLRFDGVAKIIRFNTRFYLASAAGVMFVLLLFVFVKMPLWLAAPAMFATALMVFWTLSSLVVSWYVYDYAGITRWDWMRSELRGMPSRWVNIHAGLDESTTALRRLLPGTDGVVVDIYDAATMTEPSIERARRMYPATEPFLTGSAEALPLPGDNRDAVFLLFAAHELRTSAERIKLLREARRVLKNDGSVFLVEHLRDLQNFVAFGPGFLHFHSYQTWLHDIADAGLKVDEQRKATPFVRSFTLREADPIAVP